MLGVAEESRANVQAYLFLPCVLTFGQQPVHATQCWSKDLYTEVSLSLDGSWHVTTSFTSLLEDLPRHPSNSPLQPLEIFAEEVCKQMISEAEDFTKSLRAELWYWEQKWLQIRTWDLSCHESWLVGFFFFCASTTYMGVWGQTSCIQMPGCFHIWIHSMPQLHDALFYTRNQRFSTIWMSPTQSALQSITDFLSVNT